MRGKSQRLAILCVTISVLSLVTACGGASAPAATATMAKPVATTAATNSTSPWGITLLSVIDESQLSQQDLVSVVQHRTNIPVQNGDRRYLVTLGIQNNSGTVMSLVDPSDPNNLSISPVYTYTRVWPPSYFFPIPDFAHARVWAQIKADNDFAYPKYPVQVFGALIAPGFQVHAPVEIYVPGAVTGTTVIVHIEAPGGTASIELPAQPGYENAVTHPQVNSRSFSLPASSTQIHANFDQVTYPVTPSQSSGKSPLTINAIGLSTSCQAIAQDQYFAKISVKWQVTNQYGYPLVV